MHVTKKDPKQHLDAVLHAVELPAGIAHLDSSLTEKIKKILTKVRFDINLANVDGDAFPHLGKVR